MVCVVGKHYHVGCIRFLRRVIVTSRRMLGFVFSLLHIQNNFLN